MANYEEYPVDLNRRNAGMSDIFGSAMSLVAAGTKFTFQQIESLFSDSQGVMNRVRNSMDKISNAMNQEADVARISNKSFSGSSFSGTPSDPISADVFSGRRA